MSIAARLLWLAQPLHAADAPVEPVNSERVRIVETDQIISNNLTVLKGERLVVRPGVSLRFKPGIGIISHGVIEAVGTRTKPIVFTEADKDKRWSNVALVGSGANASRFEWCRFDRGTGCVPDMTEAGELKGFLPRNSATNAEDAVGGAIFTWRVPQCEIRFCRFEANAGYWGGAILIWGRSEPVIAKNLFVGNRGGEDAGAIHCVKGADAIIEGNYIRGNSAKFGGGIHCLQSAAVIRGNWIEGNSATNMGGIACWNAEPRIDGNYIVGNSVSGDGGGVGGAGNSVLTLSGNWIDGNKDKSGTGRGLFVHQGEIRSGMKDSSKIVEPSVGKREVVVGALKKEGVADLPELIPLF